MFSIFFQTYYQYLLLLTMGVAGHPKCSMLSFIGLGAQAPIPEWVHAIWGQTIH